MPFSEKYFNPLIYKKNILAVDKKGRGEGRRFSLPVPYVAKGLSVMTRGRLAAPKMSGGDQLTG